MSIRRPTTPNRSPGSSKTGATNGTGPTTFSPDKTVTRGQLATFLWRLEGRPRTARFDHPVRGCRSDGLLRRTGRLARRNRRHQGNRTHQLLPRRDGHPRLPPPSCGGWTAHRPCRAHPRRSPMLIRRPTTPNRSPGWLRLGSPAVPAPTRSPPTRSPEANSPPSCGDKTTLDE